MKNGTLEGSIKLTKPKYALIMAAGYGTRLEPLTLAVPKPMVPIANKPTIRHNIELLRQNSIRSIIANIHYHPEQIVNYFSDGAEFGVDLAYSYEEELMGTAGGVWRMARTIANIKETFVVLSSDALTDINLREAVKFHKEKKAIATIALCRVNDVEHFGVAMLDGNQKITGFQEKPKAKDAKSNMANTGIYIFEPEILEMIPPNTFFDFGKQVFPNLIAENMPVYGYKMVEYWSDVGTIPAYMQANLDAMHGRLKLELPGKKVSSTVHIGRNCQIDKTVRFEGNVIIGDRCNIGSNVMIRNSVIGDMAVIGAGSIVDQSVIWSDSFISRGVKIEKSVIGNWCRIEHGAEISENCIISNRCLVRKDVKVKPGTSLKPREIL